MRIISATRTVVNNKTAHAPKAVVHAQDHLPRNVPRIVPTVKPNEKKIRNALKNIFRERKLIIFNGKYVINSKTN